MLLLAIFRVIVGGFATVGYMTLDVSGWQTVSRVQALSKDVEQAERSSKLQQLLTLGMTPWCAYPSHRALAGLA